MIEIAFLLPERHFASGTTASAEVLSIANGLAQRKGEAVFAWRLLSENGTPVRSSTGIALPVDGSYADVDASDVVVVPGITCANIRQLERTLAEQAPLIGRLTRWHDEGKLIASFCTGVTLLAEAGLLAGRPTSISWWLTSWFRTRYPSVQLQTHAILCESPGLLCGGATTSYLNMALRLVERYAGPDISLQCARLMLVDTQRTSQATYATLAQFSGHDDALVTRCQHWLQKNLNQPFSLNSLAAAAGSSQRTVMRRFQQVLGDTPLHYLQQLRLFAARRLLETTALGIDEIVGHVGYTDVSTFRRLFKRELNCSPGEYRRRFAVVDA